VTVIIFEPLLSKLVIVMGIQANCLYFSIKPPILLHFLYNDQECDILIYNFDNDEANWLQSCVNIPLPTSAKRLSPLVRQLTNIDIQRKHVVMSRRDSQSSTKCVTSSAGLQKAVQSAGSKSSSTPTRIKICTKKINLGKYSRLLQYSNTSDRILYNNVTDGIDLTNKNIILYCRWKRRRCTLDGRGLTRHFYGSNTAVTFGNIKFVNGYHANAGGALLIQDQSILKFTNCSFSNNTASSGGAFSINETDLTAERTYIANNKGNGNPIEIYTSTANFTDVKFQMNDVNQFVSTITVFSLWWRLDVCLVLSAFPFH
jgi:hypothetical protein